MWEFIVVNTPVLVLSVYIGVVPGVILGATFIGPKLFLVTVTTDAIPLIVVSISNSKVNNLAAESLPKNTLLIYCIVSSNSVT